MKSVCLLVVLFVAECAGKQHVLHSLLSRNSVVQQRNGNKEQCETCGEIGALGGCLGNGKTSLGQWGKRVRRSSPLTAR